MRIRMVLAALLLTTCSKEKDAIAVEQSISAPDEIRRLRAAELTQKFAGKRIMPDPILESTIYPYSEKFFSDGRWEGSFNSRGPIMRGGIWRVEADEMCVVIETGNGIAIPRKSECRSAWISEETGRISMRPLSFLPSTPDPVILSIESL